MNVTDLRAQVHSYHDFEECIIRTVRWLAFGSSIEVEIEYVWRTNDVLRSAADRLLVTLRFDVVQELKIQNRLNQAQVDEPLRLDWGFAEVATVSVEASAGFGGAATVTFWKEAGPWITVTANSVTISERHTQEA